LAKLDQQISVLQERLSQLKVRQQRVDARKRAIDAQRERKQELRRQILVGTLILSKLREGEFDPNLLRGWLDSSLTRTHDRALFDLPPIGADSSASES
jgi:hypothetical protein